MLSLLVISLKNNTVVFIFSPVDKIWYRAIILEVGEAEMSVVYADYGNSEKVPVSQILPIPTRLLQLPFKIIRCTLAGKAMSSVPSCTFCSFKL